MAGRPTKELDAEQFEKLCFIQCTQEEICDVLNVDPKTLSAWIKRHYNADYSSTYKRFSAGGKMSLRRAQMKLAEKNATMAIWLGKQYLNQRDSFEIEHTDDTLLEYMRSMRDAKTV